MLDVACVCVGDKYQPELHVKQLHASVSKHLQIPFKFNVITDQPNHPFYKTIDCQTIPVPDIELHSNNLWWYKPYLFSKHFTNRVLYFDLDVVITNDISKFVDYDPLKFCICQDFNRRWIPEYTVSNSSIMYWHAPTYYDIWDNFSKNTQEITQKYRGDQDYITGYFKDRQDLTWWPKSWAMSFKWEIFRGGLLQAGTGLTSDGKWPAEKTLYAYPEQPWVVPDDCSVVVFHGKPDPWETDFGKQHLIPDIQKLCA